MSKSSPTYVGEVDSVKGAVVAVQLRDGMPTIVMVGGESYRIGQIGAFVRIPLGYTQLYAVCTLVGAAAAPVQADVVPPHGKRWMSVTLFGESVGKHFDRGVSQYPTIGDEVHLVTPEDIAVIYGSADEERTIDVGHIAAASGISKYL